MKNPSSKKLWISTAAAVLGLGMAGAVWQGAVRPAVAQEVLALSRSGKVDGKTVGEVVLRKKVALRLQAGSGSMTPVERADLVASRLNRLDADKPLKASEVRVGNQAGMVTLIARDTNLLSVSVEDARVAGRSAQGVGEEWMDGLLDALSGSSDRAEPEVNGLGRDGRTARRDDRRDDQDFEAQDDRRRDARKGDKEVEARGDYYPDLKKKIVPILTLGSSLNVGVAQVQGEERDVDRCKAVAQIETDYKDVARIKILVPVQSEGIIKNIDRVPGVSVSALADYAIKK